MVILGLCTGARTGPSELFALKWNEVDVENAMIRLPSADKNHREDGRDIPIRGALLPIMNMWRKTDTDQGIEYVINWRGYPGLFLRGYGGQSHAQNNGSTVGVTSTLHQSGALGVMQGDAVRNITGRFRTGQLDAWPSSFQGAFMAVGFDNNRVRGEWGGNATTDANFSASSVVPTAPENRPVNRAVRYLIRTTK